jgi:hypothetical protein
MRVEQPRQINRVERIGMRFAGDAISFHLP